MLKAAQQLAAGDRFGAERDDGIAALAGYVIVVVIEATLGDARASCEGMQLIQRRIADKMSPDGAVGGPDGLVDQHGHGAIAVIGRS